MEKPCALLYLFTCVNSEIAKKCSGDSTDLYDTQRFCLFCKETNALDVVSLGEQVEWSDLFELVSPFAESPGISSQCSRITGNVDDIFHPQAEDAVHCSVIQSRSGWVND
jgi:hypothetical protein